MGRCVLRIGLLLFVLLGTKTLVWAQLGQDIHIARGSQVTLRADATDALSFLWMRNGEPINGQHDQRIRVSEEGIYTVIALGHECHSEPSDPVQVIVDPDTEPIMVDMHIQTRPDQTSVPLGGSFSYQLYVENRGQHRAHNVQVTMQLPPQLRYKGVQSIPRGSVNHNPATKLVQWDVGDMNGGESAVMHLEVWAESPGTAYKIVTVASDGRDGNPEDNSDDSHVEILSLQIPNVFTPNGDGVNDYFEIPEIETFTQNRLFVYNRHGQEVFKINNYKNDWDAPHLNNGTYYYVLEILLPSGQWQSFKGYVTILGR